MKFKKSLAFAALTAALAAVNTQAALPGPVQIINGLQTLNNINATITGYILNVLPEKADAVFSGAPANYHYNFPAENYDDQKPGYEFNNFVVFGDSISDIGSLGRQSLYLAGGYDSQLYAEYLSRYYTGKASSPFTKGGTNYGLRGASMLPIEKNRKSIREQYLQYLQTKDGKIDPKSLYIVWGGNMDANILIGKNIIAIITGKYDLNAPDFTLNNSPREVAAIAQDLLNRGAPYVFTSNIPDSTLFPYNTMLFTEQTVENILLSLKLPHTWVIRAVGRNVDSYLRNPANIIAAEGKEYFRTNQINAIYSRVFWYLVPKPVVGLVYDWISENMQYKPLNQFNYSLNQALKNVAGNVVYFDFAALINDVAYNYKEYGFDTVLVPTCTLGYSSRYCERRDPDYHQEIAVFGDWFHPGPQLHLMIGQTMQAILDAPVYASAVARQADSINSSRLTYLHNELNELRNQPEQDLNRTGIFIGYSGATDTSGVYVERKKTHTNLLNFGIYSYLNPNWLIGGAVTVGAGKNKSHLNYKYDFDSQYLSFFSQYTFNNNGWLNFTLALGRLKANDIVRSTLIYKNMLHSTGSTTSYSYNASWRGGFDLINTAAHQSGPVAELAINHYQIKGYQEQGKKFLAMKYGKYHYNNHYAGFGWYYRAKNLNLAERPLNFNITATVNHELGKRDFRVPAALITAPVSFKRKIEHQDKGWLNTQISADYAWSEHTSFNINAGYTTDFKRNKGINYALGVNRSF